MLGKMDVSGVSDRGRVRDRNEDQFLIADLARQACVRGTSMSYDSGQPVAHATQGRLVAVADGSGRRAGGDRASQLVVETAAEQIIRRMPPGAAAASSVGLQRHLRQTAHACQARIEREVGVFPDYHGMGSTLTLGYLSWPDLYLLHVGNSRCYLLRDSQLRLLTTDHNAVQSAAASGSGELRAEPTASARHRLWNLLGGDTPELHAEVSTTKLQLGDCLLFCSDGLSDAVDERSMTVILDRHPASADACSALVAEANRNGGSDNITAVVVRFWPKSATPAQAAAAEAVTDSGQTAGSDGPWHAAASPAAGAREVEADTVDFDGPRPAVVAAR
ncbi:MAG: protein phosphatase 2C domain-containing protein [Planctomycetota bacterium]